MSTSKEDAASGEELADLRARAREADALRAELASAKERLDASGQRFYGLLDTLPFCAYLIAKDHSIRFANRHFREHYGEAAGRSCYEAIWGWSAPCESCPALRVFETKEPLSWESIHQDSMAYQVFDIPFTGIDAEELVLEISIDKTHCRRLDREMSGMLAQVMHSQKMCAIGALTAGIAHDFNNIITVIKTLTDLALTRSKEQDGQLVKYLEPIGESASKAISLVQQLLVFGKNKPSNTAPQDLNDIVSDILRMLEHLVSEDISITTDLSYDIWPVVSERCRLEQIIMNLVINSSEAMPHGGRVQITTKNVTVPERPASVGTGPWPGRYVLATVEDTGCGMDAETLQSVFEPLFSTKKQSAGMGLTVVHRIVGEQGGWVGAESEPGKGATFKVYLPAAEDPSMETALCGGGQKPAPGVGKGKRVLLVEDEKWVRRSTAMVLTEYGYKVSEAANAEAALSLFYRDKGRFDLVLTDIIMPGRNGLQLVDPLLDINPSVPILLFSAHMDEKVQMEEIISKGLAYIHKPYEIADLICAVEDTIRANKLNRRR